MNEQFRIDRGVKHRCIMSPWLFNIFGCSDKGGEDGDGKEGNEIPGGLRRMEITRLLECRCSVW